MTNGETPAAGDVDVLLIRLDPGVPLPGYALPGDAGADLTAAEDVEQAPGERAIVGTGPGPDAPPGARPHPVRRLCRGRRRSRSLSGTTSPSTGRRAPLPTSVRKMH